jgi:signal transduction histidine kinase
MSGVNIKFESIRIDEKIKRIATKNKTLARIKGVNIETNIKFPATISGNKIELARVLNNILDNAIKYTPPNGKILISDKIALNKYILTIADTGSGIAKDIMDKIFDPFFRGDASRSTDGAGLGLTLVKKIIENHKGTILIKSQEDKGTSVIITLPLAS